MSLIEPLKSFSSKDIEGAFAKALSDLTGCAFSVSITSLSFSSGEIDIKLYKIPDESDLLPF